MTHYCSGVKGYACDLCYIHAYITQNPQIAIECMEIMGITSILQKVPLWPETSLCDFFGNRGLFYPDMFKEMYPKN